VTGHGGVEQIARPGAGLLCREEGGRAALVHGPHRVAALGRAVVAPQDVGLGDDVEAHQEISRWSAGRAGVMSWLKRRTSRRAPRTRNVVSEQLSGEPRGMCPGLGRPSMWAAARRIGLPLVKITATWSPSRSASS